MTKGNRIVIWFERKDYEAIKLFMPDEPYLGGTFEQWLEKANKYVDELQALGFVARKTLINHEQFATYCAEAGQDCDVATLGGFAVLIDRTNYERGE